MGRLSSGMIARYLKLIMVEAFRPTVRWTDAFQIITAALLPALHQSVGLPMPDGGQDMTFAYIGYAVVALVVLRLFFYAPYVVWAKAAGEVRVLSDRIGSPKHRIATAVEKHMIENRIKAISLLSRLRMPNHFSQKPDHVLSDNDDIFESLNTLLAADKGMRPLLDRVQRAFAKRVLTENLKLSGNFEGDPELEEALTKSRIEHQESLDGLYGYLMAKDEFHSPL